MFPIVLLEIERGELEEGNGGSGVAHARALGLSRRLLSLHISILAGSARQEGVH